MINTNFKLNNPNVKFSKKENEMNKYVYLKGPIEKPKDAFIFSLNIAPLWLPHKNMPKTYKTMAGLFSIVYGALIFCSPFASFGIDKIKTKIKL